VYLLVERSRIYFMKPLVNLALRTEYSFRETFGKVDDIVKNYSGTGVIGVADINNTFAHIMLEKAVKDKDIKPIYGVRLEVVRDPKEKVRGVAGPRHIVIAKNPDGLQEVNRMTQLAWEQFYYKPMIGWDDINSLSDNVIVLAENLESMDNRVDYIALTPGTSRLIADLDIPKVYINDNYYPTADDRQIYQLMAGTQKRKDDYYYKFNTKTCPQYILGAEEFNRLWGNEEALENTHKISALCEDFRLPRAAMVTYKGRDTIENLCEKGAKKLGIDIHSDGPYKERYDREMKLIHEKQHSS